jgi:hypothetical protein
MDTTSDNDTRLSHRPDRQYDAPAAAPGSRRGVALCAPRSGTTWSHDVNASRRTIVLPSRPMATPRPRTALLLATLLLSATAGTGVVGAAEKTESPQTGGARRETGGSR